eukprot:11992081-Alexandrium_andersonii.AAC.1
MRRHRSNGNLDQRKTSAQISACPLRTTDFVVRRTPLSGARRTPSSGTSKCIELRQRGVTQVALRLTPPELRA